MQECDEHGTLGKGHSYHVHDMLGVKKMSQVKMKKNEKNQEIDTSLMSVADLV